MPEKILDMSNAPLKLASILKKLMQHRKISLRELSRQTKIPQSTLSSYLSGKTFQKPEHLMTLANYFSTSLEYLLFGKESRVPTLEEVLTERVYEGWLKVKIERAIPTKRIGEE